MFPAVGKAVLAVHGGEPARRKLKKRRDLGGDTIRLARGAAS
jgi:hypothetical protein